VIDCDFHHARRTDEELLAYLPKAWRDYVLGPGKGGIVPLMVRDGYPNPHGFRRADAYPEAGGPPGSDLALMDEQLLTAPTARTFSFPATTSPRWRLRDRGRDFELDEAEWGY